MELDQATRHYFAVGLLGPYRDCVRTLVRRVEGTSRQLPGSRVFGMLNRSNGVSLRPPNEVARSEGRLLDSERRHIDSRPSFRRLTLFIRKYDQPRPRVIQ